MTRNESDFTNYKHDVRLKCIHMKCSQQFPPDTICKIDCGPRNSPQHQTTGRLGHFQLPIDASQSLQEDDEDEAGEDVQDDGAD